MAIGTKLLSAIRPPTASFSVHSLSPGQVIVTQDTVPVTVNTLTQVGTTLNHLNVTHHELHDAALVGCTEGSGVLNANDACCSAAPLFIRATGSGAMRVEKKWRRTVGPRYTFAFEVLSGTVQKRSTSSSADADRFWRGGSIADRRFLKLQWMLEASFGGVTRDGQ